MRLFDLQLRQQDTLTVCRVKLLQIDDICCVLCFSSAKMCGRILISYGDNALIMAKPNALNCYGRDYT